MDKKQTQFNSIQWTHPQERKKHLNFYLPLPFKSIQILFMTWVQWHYRQPIKRGCVENPPLLPQHPERYIIESDPVTSLEQTLGRDPVITTTYFPLRPPTVCRVARLVCFGNAKWGRNVAKLIHSLIKWIIYFLFWSIRCIRIMFGTIVSGGYFCFSFENIVCPIDSILIVSPIH